ncbi:MAG TPA: toll/interleukin-1 receptor domain-containing protein [Longimicrobium sp.]|nr:toll/interleukin-1 receptor domain-containing protein [Longimicrobium sp.]
MNSVYEFALLGEPSQEQVEEITSLVADVLSMFNLSLGVEVGWHVQPLKFVPKPLSSSAVLFFGTPGASLPDGAESFRRSVPIVPVVSDFSMANLELPPELRPLNALSYAEAGARRTVTALLECAGLLPRQRRVFLSYRRDEARSAAIQLFDAFSARHFDVFLDTHGVAPGDDFQATLWHRLCDSDVLVMLDTQTYFASRWTSAEFGRALAKNIPVLRVGWPDCVPSSRISTSSQEVLGEEDIDLDSGTMMPAAVSRVCSRLELLRSESIAVRRINLISGLTHSVERIGGHIDGIGMGNGIYLSLPDGKRLIAFPSVGVPTSLTLEEALALSSDRSSLVLYDHIGLHRDWLRHLDWLGSQIAKPRWVKAAEAAWQLADWVD